MHEKLIFLLNTISLLLINTPSSITEKIKWFFHNLKNGAIIKKGNLLV